MAGLIPQSFIDELVSRADIVQTIDARVPLTKAGRDYKACCPFHDEKTPSFTVSPSKQFYHCFGCGAHGTVLRFLMDYERMEFVEAVEELAQTLGLEVPREGGASAPSPESRQRFERALDALEQANQWYKRQLREHAAAARATDYLKQRGMSGRTAAHFELGFAPPGWDNLLTALESNGVSTDALADAGLLAESSRGGSRYDRFRDRIMFPIHDRRGRVIGFGARTIDDDTPKYLNSPESLTFHKGRELYGLHQILRQRGAPERLLVVEGYMDVVMLWEHGVDYACATLGTAATPDQMDRLLRSNDRVTFCFDGDDAGRRAAWRALENTLPLLRDGREVTFMFLPEGDDPDDFVRQHGAEAFEARVAEAPTLTDFLFRELRQNTELRSVEGRARLVDAAKPLITRLPSGALKTMAVERLASLSQIAAERIESLYGISGGGRARVAAQMAPAPRAPREVTTPARRAITALIHHPELARSAGNVDDLGALDVPGASLLLELIECLRAQPEMTTGGLVERFRGHPAGSAIAKLASGEEPPVGSALADEFLDCLERLRRAPMDRRFRELRERDRDGRLTESEKQELRTLLEARAKGR